MPFCGQLHSHRVFTNGAAEFNRTAPCSSDTDVRQHVINLNARLPKRTASKEYFVAGDELDDAAIDIPVPNWTE